jgi:hypothetical protein
MDFPSPSKQVDRMVDTWRDEDFDLRDGNHDANNAGPNNNYSSGTQSSGTRKSKVGGVAGIKNKAKIVKHRNLSTHLMNYSANPDLNKGTMPLKSIQTFINVADSDDPVTVSNCMIALSNVASSDHVRTLLFEVNALHKFTNMLHNIRGKAALRAAGLLFYYFSCDKETEDRVYNSCSSFLQANGASKEQETRLLSLYTLNNLLPCIDRARVADITMRIIHANFENSIAGGDRAQLALFLLIMQNMCCFSNVHSTLLGLNVLELIAQAASFAIAERNAGTDYVAAQCCARTCDVDGTFCLLYLRPGTGRSEDHASLPAGPGAGIPPGDPRVRTNLNDSAGLRQRGGTGAKCARRHHADHARPAAPPHRAV